MGVHGRLRTVDTQGIRSVKFQPLVSLLIRSVCFDCRVLKCELLECFCPLIRWRQESFPENVTSEKLHSFWCFPVRCSSFRNSKERWNRSHQVSVSSAHQA